MRVIVAGALGLGLALSAVGGAAPAHAAGPISVSPDGVAYTSTYPGTFFDAIGRMVPLDSQSESFYVRNDNTVPGFLRVVLRDVTYSDTAYATALTVRASTPATSGSPTPLTAANPCVILVEGQTVQPGEVVPITAVLALGDLNGSVGQNAIAGLTVRVELHDTSTGSLPTTTCSTAGPGTSIIVPPNRPPRPQGQASSYAKPPVVPEAPVEEPEIDLPVDPQGSVRGIEPNTWLLYEERWWFLFILAFALGSLTFMVVDWLRGRRDLEDETETSA